MVVILPPTRYQEWLDGEGHFTDYMRPFDAEQLRSIAPTPTNGSLL